jgi:hypothetical protein
MAVSRLAPLLKTQCLIVMEKLFSRPVAQMFLNAPDPEADKCADYFEQISRPMSLNMIQNKLQENEYESVQEWKADVELVWSNSLLYNRQSPILLAITRDLQKQFHEQTRNLSDSYRDTWKQELVQLHQELATCIKELLKVRTANPQKSQRTVVKRDQLYPLLEELPPAHLRRHFRPFTKVELLQMTNDLNSIKEESQVALIASLVKKQEPDLADESDTLEIDINLLRPTTLKLIRDQLDQMLHP